MTAAALGLGLLVTDLRAICDAVERLQKSGVRVREADVGRHRVTLEWHDDQRDGAWYTVESITRTDR